MFEVVRFNSSLRRIIAHLRASEERILQLWQATGVTIHSRIVERTPKDTGRAKASFRPPVYTRQGHRGVLHIGSAGVDYIIFLEFGHSKQAPTGMVRITLQEFVNQLPKFRDRIVRFLEAA